MITIVHLSLRLRCTKKLKFQDFYICPNILHGDADADADADAEGIAIALLR